MAEDKDQSSAAGPAAGTEQAYTREALDEYLVAVAARRRELEEEIRATEARIAAAELAVERIGALERAVGGLVVAAVARRQPGGDPTTHVDDFGAPVGAVPSLDAADYFEQLRHALEEPESTASTGSN